MATKKEHEQLQARLSLAEREIDSLKKEVEREKSTNKYYADRASKAEQELEQVHSFFDALRSSLPRKASEYEQRSLMTRLAAWIALR